MVNSFRSLAFSAISRCDKVPSSRLRPLINSPISSWLAIGRGCGGCSETDRRASVTAAASIGES